MMINVEVKDKLKKNLLDDMFSSQEQRDNAKLEKIKEIKIDEIDDFPNHPFKVVKNDDMNSLIESVKKYGVLSSLIVREKPDGRYELISGHRRKYASLYANRDTVPCVVKNLTDDEATIMMVDSNIQREKLLPSEKAYAYKMKMEAISHQGKATSRPMGEKLDSANFIGEELGDSGRQVQRYIRLTYLIPKLLDLVDAGTVGFRPAVELSYLKQEEQDILMDSISFNQATPSLEQAIKLKNLSQSDELNVDIINQMLGQLKPNQIPKLKFDKRKLKSVLPKNLEDNKIEDYIVKSVEYYTKYLKQRSKANKDSR